VTLPKDKSVAADDLSIEQLTTLVGTASGWSDGARITFRREALVNEYAPPRYWVSVSVAICGSHSTVSANGVDHRTALIDLLVKIEAHHDHSLRWHKQRCLRVREILNDNDIYYVKGEL
jgi:hypothetical protein